MSAFIDQFAVTGTIVGYNGWELGGGSGTGNIVGDGAGRLWANTSNYGVIKQSGFTTSTADVTVQFTLNCVNSTKNAFGAVARVQSNGECYFAGYYNNNTLAIVHYSATFGDTQIGSATTAQHSGVMEFSVTGAGGSTVTLTLKCNGVTLLSVTDSTYKLGTGLVGVAAYYGATNSITTSPSFLSTFAAFDPALSGTLTAGIMSVYKPGATALQYSAAGATLGTPPYTYAFQSSPDNSTWTNLTSQPTTIGGSLLGLPQDTSLYLRAIITDSASATATTASVAYTTQSQINGSDSNITRGYREWAVPASNSAAIWCGSSNAKTRLVIQDTGNIYISLYSVDPSSIHTIRYSIDKAPWVTAIIYGGQITNIPALVSGTVGNHYVAFEVAILGGSDKAGTTGTWSCVMLLGFIVDNTTTGTAAYTPTQPTGKHLITGTSYTNDGAVPGYQAFGAFVTSGLGTFGGQIGISGSTWGSGGSTWANYNTRVLYDPGAVSALVGGALVADSVSIFASRNDGGGVASAVQSVYNAIRAVYTGPIFIGPDISYGGGYPMSDNAAPTIQTAYNTIQAASADPKLFILNPPTYLSDGLDYLLDGMAAVGGTEPSLTFTGAGDGVHPTFEANALAGAWYAAQITAKIASLSSTAVYNTIGCSFIR